MLEQTNHGFSIRRMLRQRFLDMVNSLPAPKMGRILVVDEAARTYLDACVEQKDLFLTEVSLYEKLELPRNGFPEVDVLYLITPTWESIECLVKDFTEGSKLHAGPLYGGAYLYFTTELGDDMYQYLTQSPAASYIQNIVEYFVDFFVPEAQVFTTKTPHAISELYSTTPTKNRHLILKDMAKKIVSLNVALGENPIIKYYKPDGELNTTELSYDLAELVQEEFDSLQRGKQYLQTIDPRQPRATLLVLDRTVDLRAPLLHEVTYQAIVHDLMCLPEEATYTYKYIDAQGAEIDKEGALNEDDPIWVEYRHVPFDQCVQGLVAKITKLGNKKMVNNPDMSASAKLRQLRETLYSLPEYQDIKEKCSLHMSLSLECTELFTKLDIERLALLEQDLATGVRENGEASKHMVDEIVPVLDDPSISPDNKLRILILYILSKDGLREETWQEINFHAQLDLNKKDSAAIQSLDRLGVKLNKSSKKGSTLSKKLKTFKEPTDFLMIARYVPMVKQIVENLVQNTLPPDMFPIMTSNHHGGGANGQGANAQVFRHQAPKWTKRKKGTLGESVNQKGRIILFMIGGMTHSEMRSVYEISKELNREVIIGSTHVLPPWGFLDSLRTLKTQVEQSEIVTGMRSLSVSSISSEQRLSWSPNAQTVQIPRSLVIPKSQSPAPLSSANSESSFPPEPTVVRKSSPSPPPPSVLSENKRIPTPTCKRDVSIPSASETSKPPAGAAPNPVTSSTSIPKIQAPPPAVTQPHIAEESTVSVASISKPSSNDESTSHRKPTAPVTISTPIDTSAAQGTHDPKNVKDAKSSGQGVASLSRGVSPKSREVEPEQVLVSREASKSPPIVTPNNPRPPQSDLSGRNHSAESGSANVLTRHSQRPRPRSALPDPMLSGGSSNGPDYKTSVTSNATTENRPGNLNSIHIPQHVESYPSPSPSPPPLPVHPRLENQRVYASFSGNRGNEDQNRPPENRSRSAYNSTRSEEYRPPLPKKPVNYPSISSFTTSNVASNSSYNHPPRPKPTPPPKPLPPKTQRPGAIDAVYPFQAQYDPGAGIPMPDVYMPQAYPAPLTTDYARDSPDTFPDPMHYMPNHPRSNATRMTSTPNMNPNIYSSNPHPYATPTPMARPQPPPPMPQSSQPMQMPMYTPYSRPLPKPPAGRYHHLPQDDPIHQRYYR
ncbi:Sec1-like protein [Basidiobolus meristosporus CBS 931.73]|uniref:Sec1-like protein n=1 Tax=Basidiobolus meristosporus CBS 931.73 TaxID=1314790 RepID=A0A1Y1XZL6_9FUNG|nr:Sec1-like protein [Basidiobolus meristosporus CBS 931.73]|eukprot:ORX91203.1 Sec1-like protein [Basidiobolus meristosporus CBS 931.73]